MKARLLIAEQQLRLLHSRYLLGVPLAKLRKQYSLAMSQPVFNNLIATYEELQTTTGAIHDVIEASLFPEWLDPYIAGPQEQPKTHRYIGRFPLGAWVKR